MLSTETVLNMLTGADGSNSAGKFSLLNRSGNIESFTIPTIMAPADEKGDPLKKNTNVDSTDRLHVRIISNSLHSKYFFVGDVARGKDGLVEPQTDEKTQIIENKSTSDLHFVNILTGLAIAAIKRFTDEIGEAKTLNVNVPYYGGLPIKEFKEMGGEGFLNRILGRHTIEFLDGLHQGITVILIIDTGEIYIEGATTQMSLTNNIVEGKIVDIDGVADKLDDGDYVVGDLGAGSSDIALFEHDGLNGTSSTNYSFGTNLFIDRMITEIAALPDFDDIRTILEESGENNKSPYTNRDEFMKRVIKPVIEQMITTELKEAKEKGAKVKETKDKDNGPKFTASWGMRRNVDVTDIVLKHMKDYYDGALKLLQNFSITKAQNANNFFLVGGGLLFAYPYFKDIDYFQLPPKEMILESPFFTSRAYLIAAKLEEELKTVSN
ncbi:hypothetical protein OM416_20340 [Paenibacillus sp. LS1]|uniref:hypothetical protein n=1 Tax=Paenibacillus sp. LS1 TaxID=2992120 RepID=UPI00222EB90E|nr:hypothetical protein [Paenibacillus sp. LS1]MCW3793947.1 hypothetical protein [Paenibacillus sp. LS1]